MFVCLSFVMYDEAPVSFGNILVALSHCSHVSQIISCCCQLLCPLRVAEIKFGAASESLESEFENIALPRSIAEHGPWLLKA